MKLESTDHALDAFRRRPRALHLECGVQHYAWGDTDAIPALLDRANPDRRPFAELWAGAHPDLPSVALVDGVGVALDQLILEAPEQVLGSRITARYGGLPFLLKVLAAAQPLSLQAHPGSAQALAGFARENRARLPTDAPERSYRDPNHKPELLVALTDFHALRGFRPREEMERTLARTAELGPLAARWRELDGDLAGLFGYLMGLCQDEVNTIADPLIQRLAREDDRHPFRAETHEHWVLRADRAFSDPGRRDRGLLCIFLLNLVQLRPGQAIYLPAGELHTYLQGMGVEIMGNSNNVLRGGLTRKHVDTEELLSILLFHQATVELVTPTPVPDRPGLARYVTPAAEFELARLELRAGETRILAPVGPLIGLVTAGGLSFRAGEGAAQRLRRGSGLLVPAAQSCRIRAETDAVAWLAGVPGDASIPGMAAAVR